MVREPEHMDGTRKHGVLYKISVILVLPHQQTQYFRHLQLPLNGSVFISEHLVLSVWLISSLSAAKARRHILSQTRLTRETGVHMVLSHE